MDSDAAQRDADSDRADVHGLVITGPVGVGKTAVAFEASDQLRRLGIAHAVIDVDCLGWNYPAPPDDPFRTKLVMANLSAVWSSFRRTGTRRLILAHVVESVGALRAIREAVPGARLQVVRLRAPARSLRARVRRREMGIAREWHVQRAMELAESMERVAMESIVVETERRTVADVATEVLSVTGWINSSAPSRGEPTVEQQSPQSS